MAKKETLDLHMTALLDKAVLMSNAQIERAQQILFDMGVGGTHPQREFLLSNVMQTLAINLNTAALKSVN